jgi:hypothetical protein
MPFEISNNAFVGPNGALSIPKDDEVARKLAMLIEGECGSGTRIGAARRHGFSRQRYFQLRDAFLSKGCAALRSEKRGPKRDYRRSPEVVSQAIRHRFLDPDASSEVIAQKLRQTGFKISKRSVDRIFADYGLQKKTLPVSAGSHPHQRRDASHPEAVAPRTRRPAKSGARRPTTPRR